MRLLLDTHAFLWWFEGSSRLSAPARQAIENERANEVLVSAASAWEITTKQRLGELPGADPIAYDVPGAIAAQGFEELPIAVSDAARAGALLGPLNDPFDRMLIAQAISRDLVLVSNESTFDWYAIRRLW
ncbi:MAG: type II toxin-antitoxin system VapC family toxin [Chloroflexi bacterium]|nr:type II toxin-antitoxin system VapC family toxin [Chloroflexota bacterium]